MSADVVYEIARYGVAEDDEVLLEQAQVVRTNGSHSWRLGDSEARVTSDVTSVIRAEAALHEVRANQVTRVTAVPELVDELAFLLVSPGDRDDFDEAAWSDKLHDEHAYQECTTQTGRYRVLYVNGDRWCPWPTPEGDMLLPEEWPTVRFESCWAHLSFIETGSMVSGFDRTTLGLVNQTVAASAVEPDPGLEYDEQEVRVWRRDGTINIDAGIFLDWLVDNPLERFWDLSMGNMLPRLFVEATLNDRNGSAVWGDYLAAGEDYEPAIGATPSAEWRLKLSMPAEVIEAALDQMVKLSPELRDIVTAVREPDSEPGRARRELLDTLGY